MCVAGRPLGSLSMSASSASPAPRVQLGRRSLADRLGDRLFHVVTGAPAVLAVALVALVVYELVKQAWPAITKNGLGFVASGAWDPYHKLFSPLHFIYGTALTSFLALV